jgi:ribosomal protein L37AE/L43A
MNDLKLHSVTCPQCGAPGVVREGTRITECERCGARLCSTEVITPRYEAVANLSAAQAVNRARNWMEQQKKIGMFGRPELVLIPFHEVTGRRVGVFERKVPERKRVHRRAYNAETRTMDVESGWEYEEREDTKVMVSDVQHLTPAARTPWDLAIFDARAARKSARLRHFDLVEAQRRATVYAEEQSPSALAEQRFADKGQAEMVAASRRALFFPFWSIPVQTVSGSYEMVLEAIKGDIIAWRLPEAYPRRSLAWIALAVPGTLCLGQALYATFFGSTVFDSIVLAAVGVIATGIALHRVNRPDWALRSWPEPGTIPRLERHGT